MKSGSEGLGPDFLEGLRQYRRSGRLRRETEFGAAPAGLGDAATTPHGARARA